VVVGEFAADRFGAHIADTLEEMGCTVERFEMGQKPIVSSRIAHRVRSIQNIATSALLDRVPVVRQRRALRLATRAIRARADLILLTYDYLLPPEVDLVKSRTGAAVVMWYPDHIGNMGRMAWLAANLDGVFVKDPYLVRAMGPTALAPVYYLPEAFNPSRHRLPDIPIDRSAYQCEVTTAGTMHAARYAIFRQLKGFDVRIWGEPPPWWLPMGVTAAMHQGRYVVNEEKAVAFTSAAVVLNTLYPAEICGLNARAFEAAGVGAFQMIDWRPGLSQLFEDGVEVVSFHSLEDMLEKLHHYLARPAERQEIAAAGKARAARDHTYAVRLNMLMRTLDGLERGHPMPVGEVRAS
jgi:spore maturation protein CgeB